MNAFGPRDDPRLAGLAKCKQLIGPFTPAQCINPANILVYKTHLFLKKNHPSSSIIRYNPRCGHNIQSCPRVLKCEEEYTCLPSNSMYFVVFEGVKMPQSKKTALMSFLCLSFVK